jgi:hypothetical protein
MRGKTTYHTTRNAISNSSVSITSIIHPRAKEVRRTTGEAIPRYREPHLLGAEVSLDGTDQAGDGGLGGLN